MNFSQKILRWYQENKRDLPWRTTINAYNIWLSEIMLQQTRVAQGIPYYEKFIRHYPTVFDMAKADEEEILKLWQGLGYYSRARNMHTTAKYIVQHYNGKFPSTYKELIKLKGIGDYTASAIASISFGQKEAVLDGNVFRVLARYFGIALPINETEGKKYFKELAISLLPKTDLRDYNQGIMEFGAIQCAPRNPDCSICPLKDSCKALQDNNVSQLPVKIKKGKIKNRYFNYLVFLDQKNNTLMEQRTGKGIWQNLYQFPLLESNNRIILDEVEKYVLDRFGETEKIHLYNPEAVVHKLSHQHLITHFWIIEKTNLGDTAVSIEEARQFPVPVLIAQFMERFKF